MITAILAIADDGAIGSENGLPWPHIKDDMERFVEKTINQVVVMGRKTWDSLPPKYRPLPNRINVVVTSKPLSDFPGASGTLHGDDLTKGLQTFVKAYPDKEIVIIGGAEIYKQCLPACDKLYITKVHGEYEGDVFMDYDELIKGFEQTGHGLMADATRDVGEHLFTFQTWKRQ